MKNKNIIILLGIFILAIAVRIYFLIVTQNQALWWDEAEYLNFARTFATGIALSNTGITKPLLLSLILTPICYFFTSLPVIETISKVVIIIFSLLSIYGIYLCGKEIYNERVGILCAFLLTVSYLQIYLTTKILTELPSFAMLTFAIYFFYKHIKSKQAKYLYFATIFFALGTLFRISILPILLIYLVYVLKKDIKWKHAFISAGIFLVIFTPYLIYEYITYHQFALTAASASVAPMDYIGSLLFNLPFYISILIKYTMLIDLNANMQMTYTALVLLFFLVVVLFNKDKDRNTFLMCIVLIPLLSTSLLIGHGEERYGINSLLGLLLIFSFGVVSFYNFIKNKNKLFAYIFIIIFVLFFSIQLITVNSLMTDFVPKSIYIKEVSFWVRDNLAPGESTVATNPMQISYYSSTLDYRFPINKTEFDDLLKTKNIKYFIVFYSEIDYMIYTNWTQDYKTNLSVINQTKDFVIYRYNR